MTSSKGNIPPTVALNALVDHAENEAEQEIAKGMQEIRRQIFTNPLGVNVDREGRVAR